MTYDVQSILEALALPKEASVNTRIAKKLLTEHGAPTAADKRAIQDGIDELQWLAVCKPNTIGVPAFRDSSRDYSEISVLACVFREGAREARLIELIHRSIPYPIFLITSTDSALTVSVGHKRRSLGETGRYVVERIVSADLAGSGGSDIEAAFIANLAVSRQPLHDMLALYDGWCATIEALLAARMAGSFTPTNDSALIQRRRAALETLARNAKDISGLRSKARREKQMSRRVELNLQIQRLEADTVAHKKDL